MVLLTLLVAGLQCGIAQSENIFDTTASLQYAQHLYKSKEYRLAQEEFQRLHYFLPESQTVLYYLLETQRLNGAVQEALNLFQESYANTLDAPPRMQQQFYRLLLDQQRFDRAAQLNQESPVFKAERQKRRLALLLRQGQLKTVLAETQATKITDQVLSSLINRAQNIPNKSPALAGIMSGLIPGAGRMYSGNWSDGLISLATVGGSIFGAVRGFEARGIESAYGWIFGAVGATFYVSNIYGSVRSAQRYNRQQLESYHQDVESYLYRLD